MDQTRKLSDLFSVRDRVTVVTGGSERLGRSMAAALAEAGATVLVTSRDEMRAREAAGCLRAQTGGRVEGVKLAFTDAPEVQDVFERLFAAHGRIDILINNASGRACGPAEGAYANCRPEDHPPEHWETTIRQNLTHSFWCCRAVAAGMKRQRSGSIINVSSVSALLGRDRWVYADNSSLLWNTMDYSAAKAGLIGLTQDLAAQLGGWGIRVNALCPGGFQQAAHPPEFVERFASLTMLGRMGRMDEDLKGATIFLGSDASTFMTGQLLVIDGGMATFR